jgi:RNA polymerase sigma-70 factor (ECF subfamily)
VSDRSTHPAAALAQLASAHAGEVHRFLSRLTGGDEALTEDLMQDVFVTALRRTADGRSNEIGLAWLLTVARSRFIDHVRTASSRSRREQTDARKSAAGWVHVDAHVASADQARWMLAQLSEVERTALALAVVDGMPVEELAEVLGRSIDATHSLLARARRRLRLIMEGQSQ